jgi:hypothetical protein
MRNATIDDRDDAAALEVGASWIRSGGRREVSKSRKQTYGGIELIREIELDPTWLSTLREWLD